MPNRTNRTPSDTDANRRKVRLDDPEDSGHFDPALAADPYGLPDFHVHEDDITSVIVAEHAHPYDGPHEHADALPAVPPSDVQAADPPATPDVSGETPEPSHTPDVAAGSGGRVGRSLVRPDARESVLAALGGVYNPAAEPGYAIRLAEDFARLMVMGPHFARLVQANADKEPPDPVDVRVLYRKLRQIAATHGIDLDGESHDPR